MRRIDRRGFINVSSKALGAGFLGGIFGSCGRPVPPPDAPEFQWNWAICNEIMEEWTWEKQCAYSVSVGYRGIEVAPFTLGDHVDELSAERRREMRRIAADAGIDIIGLHWLLVKPEGLHVTTPDEDVRTRSWEYVRKLIDFCGDLGGKVMVFGSPRQRGTQGIPVAEAKAHLTEGLASVADHAGQRDVQILLEALSKEQTDVVNTVAEAVEVVRAVNHPAIQSMFDFHNTPDETEPLDQIIRQFFPYIKHVHVQEMDGRYMGTGTGSTDYLPAFRALKELNYQHWVSLEVFDFEPGPERIASESMRVLQGMVAQI